MGAIDLSTPFTDDLGPNSPTVVTDTGAKQSKVSLRCDLLPATAYIEITRPVVDFDHGVVNSYEYKAPQCIRLATIRALCFINTRHDGQLIEAAKFIFDELDFSLTGSKDHKGYLNSMLAVAHVLDEGATKYGDNNWRGLTVDANINHMLIHCFAYLIGDTQDAHLSHAACRAMFALELALTNKSA